MPRRDAPPLTRGVVLRSVVFAAAVALGAIAVWLVVTGTDAKATRLGMLAGLWGLLLGTFALIGGRRGYAQRDDTRAFEQRVTPAVPAPSAIELRSDGVLERQRDAEERQAWREKLEALIREEVQEAFGREVSSLRAEIASLRGDLLEKVGGQLRLERIETTRVIGSDLEALQHEVRQLKNARDSVDLAALFGTDAAGERSTAGVTRRVVEPAQVRPVSRQTQQVEDDVQPARWSGPAPILTKPVVTPPVAVPPVAAPPAAAPPGAQPPVVTPVAAPPPVAQPPVATPPIATPPVATPPIVTPPVATPPVATPPVATPPVATPRIATPPVATPPPVRWPSDRRDDTPQTTPAEPARGPEPARSSRHGEPDDVAARRGAHAAPTPPPTTPPSTPPRHSFAADDTGPIWSRPPEPVPPPPSAARPERSASPPDSLLHARTAPPADPTPAAPSPPPALPAEPVHPPATSAAPTVRWAFEGGLESLPRLTPFTDIDPDPEPTDATTHPTTHLTADTPTPAAGHRAGHVAGHVADHVDDDYRGRRRRRDDDDDAGVSRRARHAEPATGRRRRADDADDEGLLAQLLERETAR